MYIITVKIPMNNKWFVVCQRSGLYAEERNYISLDPNPVFIIQFETVCSAERFAKEYLGPNDEVQIVRMTQKSMYRRFKSRGWK